jgi:hypothetical protein
MGLTYIKITTANLEFLRREVDLLLTLMWYKS